MARASNSLSRARHGARHGTARGAPLGPRRPEPRHAAARRRHSDHRPHRGGRGIGVRGSGGGGSGGGGGNTAPTATPTTTTAAASATAEPLGGSSERAGRSHAPPRLLVRSRRGQPAAGPTVRGGARGSTTAVTQQPVVNHLHHQRFHHGSVRLAAAEQTSSEGSDGQHLSHHLMPQQLSVGLSGMELLRWVSSSTTTAAGLALAAHGPLRVKDTHAALKLSLEPHLCVRRGRRPGIL